MNRADSRNFLQLTPFRFKAIRFIVD